MCFLCEIDVRKDCSVASIRRPVKTFLAAETAKKGVVSLFFHKLLPLKHTGGPKCVSQSTGATVHAPPLPISPTQTAPVATCRLVRPTLRGISACPAMPGIDPPPHPTPPIHTPAAQTQTHTMHAAAATAAAATHLVPNTCPMAHWRQG